YRWVSYPNRNLWVGKMDKQGNNLWEKEYTLTQPAEPWDMATCQDSGFVVVCEANDMAQCVKLNKAGELVWEKIYTLGEKMYPRSVIALDDGGYALAGAVYNKETKYHAFLLKVDNQGNKQWTKTFVKTENDVNSALIEKDKKGNIILAATHEYNNYKGEQEIYLAKLNPQGEMLWEKTICGTGTLELGGLAITSDNQILLTGYLNYETHEEKSEIFLRKVENGE
ncbi:MAG: hypothetical protein ACKVTZ_16335, partial [Bacteroidia bacterium]